MPLYAPCSTKCQLEGLEETHQQHQHRGKIAKDHESSAALMSLEEEETCNTVTRKKWGGNRGRLLLTWVVQPKVGRDETGLGDVHLAKTKEKKPREKQSRGVQPPFDKER